MSSAVRSVRSVRWPLAAVVLLVTALVTSLAAPSNAASRSEPPYDHYVALGDSYTAGPFIPQTSVAGGCLRSSNNYPSLLAQRLDVDTFVDRSCSGARSTDLTGSQQTIAGPVPPQFDALTADTDLVTLGIGGNDFSLFSTLVDTCTALRSSDPTGAPCRDQYRSELRADVDQIQDRLIDAVAEIHRLSPDARIIVVGYPRIAPDHGTCPALLPLADRDYRFATEIGRGLNHSLLFAAARTRAADFVDVDRVSKGHDICADDPWINGQITDPTRALAYHPFAAEMVAVADAVVGELS